MLLKFCLPLLNFYLIYLQSILRIPLLKFYCKPDRFIKHGTFSVPKICIVVSTGFCFIVNSCWTLIFIPLSQVEKLFVFLFTVGVVVSLVSITSMLVYLDDFVSLLNMLLRLDRTLGKIFSGN